MLLLSLLLAAAPPDEAFVQAWTKGDVPKALTQLSDNARFTFSMDQRVPDQTFDGKAAIAGALLSFLPGLTFDREQGRIAYPWLKKLGLDDARATLETTLASDGRIAHLRLALSPDDSARAAAALPEQNKSVVRRYYDEVNRKNFFVVDEVLLPSFVQHSMVAVSPGREGVAQLYRELQTAFPDFNFTLDDLIAEGNQVAVRMTGRYTHKGEFLGIAPTGKAISLLKMDVFKLINGRCYEHWDAADRLGLLQQLGVVPKLPRWNYLPGYEGFR